MFSLYKLGRFVMSVVVLGFLANIGFAAQAVDSIELQDLVKDVQRVRSLEGYQQMMGTIREHMRTKVLTYIWAETQKNPSFQMGTLKFRDLFERLDRFQIYQPEQGRSFFTDPERQSDFYVLKEDWGMLNSGGPSESVLSWNSLLLHVFLGAAGFQDENYQLTLSLLFLNHSLSPLGRDFPEEIQFQKVFPQTGEQLYRNLPNDIKFNANTMGSSRGSTLVRGGGFTGVGGGGDSTSVGIKTALLEPIFNVTKRYDLSPFCVKRWKDPTTYLQDVMKIEIESVSGLGGVVVAKDPGTDTKILVPRFKTTDEKILNAVTSLVIFMLCDVVENAR